jgi:hypothetical protein
VVTKCKEIVKE